MFSCVHNQLPVIAIQLKMLPLFFGFIGAALACYSNFYTIFMQGGVGKNGSTVAVSLKVAVYMLSVVLHLLFSFVQ